MCKRCRSFFSLLKNSEDFDTRRKEEAFKKQKEENFSSEVFPWSSFEDDEDDDDSDDDSDAMMGKRKVLVVLGGGIAGAKCAEELLRLTEDVPLHRYEIVLIEKSKVLKGFDEETGMMTRTTVLTVLSTDGVAFWFHGFPQACGLPKKFKVDSRWALIGPEKDFT